MTCVSLPSADQSCARMRPPRRRRIGIDAAARQGCRDRRRWLPVGWRQIAAGKRRGGEQDRKSTHQAVSPAVEGAAVSPPLFAGCFLSVPNRRETSTKNSGT